MNDPFWLVTFALGCGVGWAAGRNWAPDRIPRGTHGLLRHVYVYVDDRIGATKTEHIRRANRRHRVIHKRDWYWWLVPIQIRKGIADYFWAVPQWGTGIAALPSTKRMGRYVRLEFNGEPVRGRYRLHQISAVEVFPTGEVDALAPGFVPAVTRWVAWALRLASPDQLDVAVHLDLGYIRFERKGPAPERPTHLPVGVNADA